MTYLAKNMLDIDWYDNIYLWLDWYKGKVSSFHKYNVYNGHKWIKKERHSLQMPKFIAEDWATLLYNDRTEIKVDETHQKTLLEILKNNKFESEFSKHIERYMALGIGATVAYKDTRNKTKISYIIAPMIFPLRVENGEIVDCAFASVVGDEYYINLHEKTNAGNYRISNYYVRINTSNEVEMSKNNKVKKSYLSPVKMFQIYTPCIANNIDVFSAFGISVFGNSLDRVKTVDLIYDSYKNEFELGKKRIFVRSDLLDYKMVTNEKGETVTVPLFDDNDTEFYTLPKIEDDDSEQIKEVNSTLRVTEHIDGLQNALNVLSDGCGLGNNRYSFKDGKVYTNETQVISTESKLYKNLLKHEKVLRESMIELVKALLYLNDGKEYTGDITIDFDDSIVEDSSEIQRRALLEFNTDLIDAVEYFVQVYKYTEEQAIEFVEKIKARMPQEPAELPVEE